MKIKTIIAFWLLMFCSCATIEKEWRKDGHCDKLGAAWLPQIENRTCTAVDDKTCRCVGNGKPVLNDGRFVTPEVGGNIKCNPDCKTAALNLDK